MMQVGAALEALIAGLRGRAVSTADWQSVIALANRSLLTPALFSALAHSGEIDRLPYDVREYLEFIHDRNWERNVRLRAQLAEAVAALNRRGIVPLLLKGAVPLFLSPASRIPARMTSDLDLSVEAAEEADAQECLGELDYIPLAGARGMARPQDVGVLELRRSQGSAFGPRRSSNGIASGRKFRPRSLVPCTGSYMTSSKRVTIGAGELTSGTFMISRKWRKATIWTGRRCGRPCRTKGAATRSMLSSSPCTSSSG